MGCDKLKRLIKQSIMNIEMFKGSLNQLSDEGRNILKLIEDYKFKLDQTCRLTANDQQLTQKLQQKRKQLDVASGQIYSIVFDIDNIDITQAYEQQQINTNPNMPSQNNTPNTQPNTQPQTAPQQSPASEEGSSDEGGPVGGGAVPDGSTPGSKAPSSDEKNGDEDKDTEKTEAPENNDDSAPDSNDGNEDNNDQGNEEE